MWDKAGRLAQLVRASALQAEGHPFEPDTAHQKDLVIQRLGHRAIEPLNDVDKWASGPANFVIRGPGPQ